MSLNPSQLAREKEKPDEIKTAVWLSEREVQRLMFSIEYRQMIDELLQCDVPKIFNGHITLFFKQGKYIRKQKTDS